MRALEAMAESSEPVTADGPAFVCSRRRFLPALIREVTVMLGMARGKQGGRLSDLADLPEGELSLIRPVINPAGEILVQDEQVCFRTRETEAVVPLFLMEDQARLVVFNLFDGQHTLREAGARVAQEMGWEEARGFAAAREVFLFLVGRWVCAPKDPPGELG